MHKRSDGLSSIETIASKYWNIFDTCYREPQRHYHNFYHLKRLVDFYDQEALPMISKLYSGNP